MDKRIVKTRKAIRRALIELAEEKPIEKITVKELCDRAEISKPAFYSHYGNLYDVVEEIEDESISQMLERMLELNRDDMFGKEFLRDFGEQVYTNPLRNVLKSEAEKGGLGRKFVTALGDQRKHAMGTYDQRKGTLAIGFAFEGLLSIMQRVDYETYQRIVPELSTVMKATITAFD